MTDETGAVPTAPELGEDGFAPLVWIAYYALSIGAGGLALDAFRSGALWGFPVLVGSIVATVSGYKLARFVHARRVYAREFPDPEWDRLPAGGDFF